jgi:hypothetical protein
MRDAVTHERAREMRKRKRKKGRGSEAKRVTEEQLDCGTNKAY